VLEVADQLTQDPGLVRVRDTAELLLHDRLGQDLRPGQVVQFDLAQFALVHLVGCCPATAGISLEIVRTASNACSRAMSR
jgi:hypothetical protein